MSTHTLSSDWRLALSLAVGFHLFVLLSAMVLPGLLQQQPVLLEVTTIDLVSLSEPAGQNQPATPPAPTKQAAKPEPAPSVPPPPAEIIKPEVTKQVPVDTPSPVPVPTPEPTVAPEPVAPPPPAEAISIKPLKQKVKKEIKDIPDPRVADAKLRKEELKNITKKLQAEARQEEKKKEAAQETIKQQRQLAAAREEARRLDLEAKLAAAEAKNALREQLRAATRTNDAPPGSSAQASSNASMNIAQQQYLATLSGHIQQYWQPPDVKSWDPNLEAVVSITIASNGQIVSQVFEKESGDRLFDQFVVKTLEAANPAPALPPAMNTQRFEIGLRFKPSGIQ